MKKILLISLSMLFAGEMEVDGNLKVTGQIDASNQRVKNVGPPSDMMDAINAQALQDVLRNEGPFEYMFIYMNFVGINDGSNSQRHIRYLIPTDFSSGDISWVGGGMSQLNLLSLQGWEISARFLSSPGGSDNYAVYELRRRLNE